MSKYKLVVIGVYFGKLPQYFDLWLNSCKNNKTIDFLVFTDQEIKRYPNNVKVIKYDLSQMKIDASNILGFEACLNAPYKCCDYKVIYGKLFANYIKEYDFWAHCDFDMIFGDIRKYITDDVLDKHDKILRWGHLSFYRNNDKFNNFYKLSGSECGNYKEVYTSDKIFTFDEIRGIYKIYEKNGGRIFDELIFADVSARYKRFRLNYNDHNHEIFCYEKGHVYRYYVENNQINRDEFIYVHFQKRKKIKSFVNSLNYFYISGCGFFDRDKNDNIIEYIKKYNKYNGALIEKLQKRKALFKEKIIFYKRAIKNKINSIKK